jgi:hypothetical protein
MLIQPAGEHKDNRLYPAHDGTERRCYISSLDVLPGTAAPRSRIVVVSTQKNVIWRRENHPSPCKEAAVIVRPVIQVSPTERYLV